jgi:hypothetical protein
MAMVNVNAFGAQPDGKYFVDAAMTAMNDTLTSATAAFTAGDVGKAIVVLGAGADGRTLVSQISGFTSATTVTLADPAMVTIPNADVPNPAAVVWMTDNTVMISAARDSLPAEGGTLFFPGPGAYVIEADVALSDKVKVVIAEGALIAPARASFATEGPIECHPAQWVFGGIGYVDDFAHSGTGPDIDFGGLPWTTFDSIAISIVDGGAVGAATFKYSMNGGLNYVDEVIPTAAAVALPYTGLTIFFPAAGTYHGEADPNHDLYTFSASAPIVLGDAAFARYSVENFGGRPDYVAGGTSTDNLPFFRAALGAMASVNDKSRTLTANGHFYLAHTLHLRQTIHFAGTARNEPDVGGFGSAPGTWLVFPRDCDGLRLHSSADLRGPGADYSVLENFTLTCKEERPLFLWPPEAPKRLAVSPPLAGQTGTGIHANCQFHAQNVVVENFGEHGFFINAGDPPAEVGNAIAFLLMKCTASKCGGNGFRTFGNGTSAGLAFACESVENWGWGFVDSTPGNSYIACLGEGNHGEDDFPDRGYRVDGRNHDYKTDTSTFGGNASAFFGCYTEEADNHLAGSAGAFGGFLGQGIHGAGFSLSGDGTAHDNALAYQAAGSSPNVRTEIGSPAVPMISIISKTDFADLSRDAYNTLLFRTSGPADGWWAWTTEDGLSSDGQDYLRFPSSRTPARPFDRSPWLPRGLRLGSGDAGESTSSILFVAASAIPETYEDVFDTNRTYEAGDVVWNSNPAYGAPVGHVCMQKGTRGDLNGATFVSGSTTLGSEIVEVDDIRGFSRGSYITIAGEPDPAGDFFQVTSDPTSHGLPPPNENKGSFTIQAAATVGVAPTTISLRAPVFGQFGAFEKTGRGNVETAVSLTLDVGDVALFTADARTATLPKKPAAGDECTVICAAGAGTTTTVTSVPPGSIHGLAGDDTVADGAPARYRWFDKIARWVRVA